MTAPRTGDVVAEIKRAVKPGAYDLLKAEGRADFDDALRAELAKITDERLRQHAAQIIREWRQALFDAPAREHHLRRKMHGTRHG